jgi:sulfide dehydrogenase cytochrome subunit
MLSQNCNLTAPARTHGMLRSQQPFSPKNNEDKTMTPRKSTVLSWTAAALLLGVTLVASNGVWAADAAKLAEGCANCHGKDGVSTESDVPTIAGFSAAYVSESLMHYKKKERHCPEAKYHSGDKKGQKTDMCAIANDLSDADMKGLAQYYAGKKFVRAQQNFDPALAKKGKELHDRSCEKCHSENGSVAKDDSGILAGQWMPYLQEALADFKAGKRPIDKKMKPKIEKLDKADFDALVNYYGSFK